MKNKNSNKGKLINLNATITFQYEGNYKGDIHSKQYYC